MAEQTPLALSQLARRYRVTRRRKFSLDRFDPADSRGQHLKDQADALLKQSIEVMTDLQERLYAQDRWSVLLVFQALDAAGKDGIIKHVMSGLNPQGCEVHSFKAPSSEELDHDFLWRTSQVLPRRGHIGIFNRSYYEEMLVVRVHPEILAGQQLPEDVVTPNIWAERFTDVVNYERYLARQGVVIRKFFLHVSKEEQRRRFLERLREPEKNWKFSLADVHEREHFGEYLKAYEDVIRHTATPFAPWYVVPADHKWFTRLVVAAAVIDAIESVQPAFPVVDAAVRQKLRVAQAALESEAPPGRPVRRARASRSR
ncbi:MAG TPA: PPK2 family polyphosphate kinase [Nonomuraea sp.]|nr:PPK2 family polyphosphate kinase [Nonomuraea sp.]